MNSHFLLLLILPIFLLCCCGLDPSPTVTHTPTDIQEHFDTWKKQQELTLLVNGVHVGITTKLEDGYYSKITYEIEVYDDYLEENQLEKLGEELVESLRKSLTEQGGQSGVSIQWKPIKQGFDGNYSLGSTDGEVFLRHTLMADGSPVLFFGFEEYSKDYAAKGKSMKCPSCGSQRSTDYNWRGLLITPAWRSCFEDGTFYSQHKR